VSADYLGSRREDRMATTVYTAIIEKEGNLYAALCLELDVASQGATVEEQPPTCGRLSSCSWNVPTRRRSSAG
jgi:hypothetical protein